MSFLFLFHPKGENVGGVGHAVFEAGAVEECVEEAAREGLVGTSRADGEVVATVGFGEADDAIPLCGAVDADKRGVVDFLVRPECVADVVVAHCLAEFSLPLGGIVANLAMYMGRPVESRKAMKEPMASGVGAPP